MKAFSKDLNKQFYDSRGGAPVFVTEFEGEGVLECEYFFRLI